MYLGADHKEAHDHKKACRLRVIDFASYLPEIFFWQVNSKIEVIFKHVRKIFIFKHYIKLIFN
jgi:hypothetical protein